MGDKKEIKSMRQNKIKTCLVIQCQKRLTLWLIITYLIVLLTACLYNFSTVPNNFDAIPYVACIIQINEPNLRLVHQKTYNLIQESVNPITFDELRAGIFRERMWSDYRAFSETLPFYKIRPLYIASAWCLTQLGMSPVTALIFLSSISYGLIGILILAWISRYQFSVLTWVAILSLMCSQPLLSILRTLSPDGMAAFFVLLAFYLLIEQQSLVGFAATMILATTIRSEKIIILLIVLGYCKLNTGIMGLISWWKIIVWSGLGLGVCCVINLYSGHYGWKAIVYHTCVEHLSNPRTQQVTLSIVQYVRILARELINSVLGNEGHFITLPLFLLIGTMVEMRSRLENNILIARYKLLVHVAILSFVAQLLVLPRAYNRFFAAQCCMLCLAALILHNRPVGTFLKPRPLAVCPEELRAIQRAWDC